MKILEVCIGILTLTKSNKVFFNCSMSEWINMGFDLQVFHKGLKYVSMKSLCVSF